jgi:Helicase conserved C-terminal domain/Type III restriction enzyme, res subunit
MSKQKQKDNSFIYYPEPKDPDFFRKIHHKKEFYINRQTPISPDDSLCTYTGDDEFKLLPQQKFLQNLISPNTPYNNVLIFHGMGSGKTRGAISIAEGFKDYIRTMNESGIPARVYIISNAEAKNNFKDTLLYPCGKDNPYITPKECEELDYLQKSSNPKHRERYAIMIKRIYKRLSNKKYDGYYKFMSYKKFQHKTIGEKERDVRGGGDEDSDEDFDEDSDDSRRAPIQPDNEEKNIKKKLMYKLPTKGVIKNLDNCILIIDEAHNITENDWGKAVKYIYNRSKNLRLILMTGTPMMHRAFEIVKLLNIVKLGTGEHLSVKDVFEGQNMNTLKSDGLKKIREFSRGYISYLRGLNPYSFPQRIDMGIIPKFKSLPPDRQMKYTPLVRCTMGKYQYFTYKENDNDKFNAAIKNIVDIVYPNPDSTKVGLHDPKILLRLQHTHDGEQFLKKNGIRFIKSDDAEYIEIDGDFLNGDQISKYSTKFHTLLKNLNNQINNNVGKAFIYTNYVKSVGALLIKRLLLRNGYEEFSFANLGTSNNPKTKCFHCGQEQGKHKPHPHHEFYPATFVTLTGQKDKAYVKQLIDQFNSADNIYGKYIKIIIGSPMAREAIDFKGIRTIHIMNYPRNYSTIEQIIGRGIRNCSHAPFPPENRNVQIYRYVASLENDTVHTIEERKYIDGEKNHILIKRIERVLKENAIDCTLNKPQNISEEEAAKYKNCETSKNKSKCTPQCEYLDCNYQCSGYPNVETEKHGLYPAKLKLDDLDKSTYAAYPNFYKHEILNIKNKITEAFKSDVVWTLDQLIEKIKKTHGEYIEDRFIYLALEEMIDKQEPVFNFFNVPGKIIYRGKYYIFQPDNAEEDISLIERAQPGQVKTEQIINISDYLNNYVTETEERFEKFDFNLFKEAIKKHSDISKISKIATKQDLKIQQDVLEEAIENVLKLYLKYPKLPSITKIKESDLNKTEFAEFSYNRKILDTFRDYLIRSDQLASSTSEYTYTSSEEILSDSSKKIIGHYLSAKPRCYNLEKKEWDYCGKEIKIPTKKELKYNDIVIGYLSKDRRNRIVFKLMIPDKEEIDDRRKRTRGFVCKQNNDKKILFDIAKKLGIELKRDTQEYLCDKIEIELRRRQRTSTNEDVKKQFRWFFDYLEYTKHNKDDL